jgi:hypothetical protein
LAASRRGRRACSLPPGAGWLGQVGAAEEARGRTEWGAQWARKRQGVGPSGLGNGIGAGGDQAAGAEQRGYARGDYENGAVAIAAVLSGIVPGACSTSSTEAELKEELEEAVVQTVAELGVAKALMWVLCWARAG